MLDYRVNIPGNEVFIGFYDEFNDQLLHNNAIEVCSKYNLNIYHISDINEINSLSLEKKYKIVHLIVRVKSYPDFNLVNAISDKKLGEHNSASIAFSYNSIEHSLKFINEINSLKDRYGDCINIMRPDTNYHNMWTVSQIKLLDNIICDTIRVKYSVAQVSDKPILSDLTDYQMQYFINASNKSRTKVVG